MNDDQKRRFEAAVGIFITCMGRGVAPGHALSAAAECVDYLEMFAIHGIEKMKEELHSDALRDRIANAANQGPAS